MCEFLIQKKALTFYSQSLICHCNALVLLSFIILPYKTSALCARDFLLYRKLLSCKILCIAQRVAGHGANSNDFNIETRQVPECT